MAIPKKNKLVSDSKRKLMKSSAAMMPAILTLRSGAAFAQSSADACIARDQALAIQQKPNWAIQDNSGPWVRIECAYIVIEEIEIKEITVVRKHRTIKKKILVDKDNSSSFVVVLTDRGWRNLDFANSFGPHRYNKFVPRTKWLYSQAQKKGIEVIVMKSESGGQNRFFKIIEGNPYQEDSNDTTWVLAQVDKHGSVIGFGSSEQYNHLTGSCWASINPGLGDFA